MPSLFWLHSILWTCVCLLVSVVYAREGWWGLSGLYLFMAVLWIPSRLWFYRKWTQARSTSEEASHD